MPGRKIKLGNVIVWGKEQLKACATCCRGGGGMEAVCVKGHGWVNVFVRLNYVKLPTFGVACPTKLAFSHGSTC